MTLPPRRSPWWQATVERLALEIEARAGLEPTRAAFLLTVQARLQVLELGDLAAATHALERASDLAPDVRFVENTWRWLAELGEDTRTVLHRARAELTHVGEGRERAALLWRIAAIEEHAVGDILSARQTIRELLAQNPRDTGAWDAYGALFLRMKSNEGDAWDEAKASDNVVFEGVVKALDVLAQSTTDATTRAALQGSIGALRDRYLDDPRGAKSAIRLALESDETNVTAGATLETLLLGSRAWDEYATLVETQGGRLASDPRAASECFERAGDVYAECLGDHLRAAHCYLRAATTLPNETGPIEKLLVVLENAGRWEEVVEAYRALLERVHEPAHKAWALVRLGTLQETRLEDPEAALGSYRLAIETAPTFAPAIQSLLRLARARGMTALVIELERREADRIADPLARAVRYAALAEVVEASTGTSENGRIDPKGVEDATLLYERALGLDRTNAAAFDALDRIYRSGGQWPRLVTLYEAAITESTDKRRTRALRLELAEIVHARIQDPARAATLLREALQGPDDRFHVLVTLARSLADAGRWPEYVEVLEAQAGMLGGAEEIAAVYRIGAALETRVRDLGRALLTYEVVLDRAPRHEAAARAILRIHEQENRWEKVVDAERRLLDLATRPEDAIEGWLRIARIAEVELGRSHDAIAAYTEVLDRAPTHAPAAAALERILRATGDYRRLAQMLQRFADASPDRHARARAMMRAAAVLELCMGDADSASAAYSRALLAVGVGGGVLEDDRHAALWGLVRLHELRSEWDSVDRTLLALIETTTEKTARLRILGRLARNTELYLGDITRAASFFDEALEVGARPAAVAVDRLRLARLGGASDTIATRLAGMAHSTTDVHLQNGLFRVLALLYEHHHDPSAAVVLYERLVSRDPEDAQALEGIVRCTAPLRGEATPDPRFAQALIARARGTVDPSLRAILALTAGAVDDAAGRASDAEVAYTFSLLADPELLPALDAQRRLRVQAGDWSAAASLAERAAAASLARENVARAWLEAGAICAEQLEDRGRALACYRRLLETQPEHKEAHERALALVESTGDWTTASVLLLSYAEAASDVAAKVKAYSQRAALLAGRLHDTPAAITDLRRALALRPQDEDTTLLEVLALLEERVKHWQEALSLHGRVARAATDPVVQRRARLAEARIHADELRDYAAARALLEGLVATFEGDREVLVRLASIAARSGDEPRAVEIHSQLTTTGTPSERTRALVALADLKRARPDLWPAHEAEATIAQAFDMALKDASVIAVLEERASKDGDYRPFVTQAEAAIARVPPSTSGILPVRTALARTLREKLGNPTAADRQLSAAILAFPDSMPTRLALATALRGRNDEAALAELRRAVEHAPTAPEPFEALVTLTLTTGRPGIGAMLASAAAMLGGGNDEIEVSLADVSPPRPIPDTLLFDEAMGRLVGPPRTWFLRNILAVLDPFLPKIFPGAEQLLETSTRLPESYPIVAEVRAIAAAVGCPPPTVVRSGTRDVMLLLTEPRALVLGSDLLTDAAKPTAMFHAAYICSRIAANGSVYTLPRQQIVALLDAAAKPEADGPLVRDLRKRIGSALPRKNKKELERIITTTPGDIHGELVAWEAEEARRALYSAILLCRDLRAVGQVLAGEALAAQPDDRRRALASHPQLREVLDFVISPACWDVYKRIYGRS